MWHVASLVATRGGALHCGPASLVYGADIDDQDISITTEEGSPWKTTAGADPRYIRTSLIRMAASSAAYQLEGNVSCNTKVSSGEPSRKLE